MRTYTDVITPRDLDSTAALLAAEQTAMRKMKGERDTEFVKRIVAAYLNATGFVVPSRPLTIGGFDGSA